MTTNRKSYDTRGRVHYICNKYSGAVCDNGGISAEVEFDGFGRVEQFKDPFGSVIKRDYDDITGTIATERSYTAPQSGTAQLTSYKRYTYDTLGRVADVEVPLFRPEANENVVAELEGIDEEIILNVHYVYDARDNVVEESDNLGNIITRTFDSVNRVKLESRFRGSATLSVTVYGYDEFSGQLTSKSVTKNGDIYDYSYEYDILGRQIRSCVAHGTDERCSVQIYNTGGQVIWSADEEISGNGTVLLPIGYPDFTPGNEKLYTYNAFGQLTKVFRRMTYSGKGADALENASINPFYTEPGWISTENVYQDGTGRLIEQYDDNRAKTVYTYTNFGNLESESYYEPGAQNLTRSVTFGYDSYEDVNSITYEQDVTTLTVNLQRDGFGRVTQKQSVGDISRSHHADRVVTQEYHYHDNINRLSTIEEVKNGQVTSTISRDYDSFGMVYKEGFKLGSEPAALISSQFSMPTAGELQESVTYPGGEALTRSYQSGLLDTVSLDGRTLSAYDYDANMRLQSVEKNLISGVPQVSLNFTYNEWNKTDTRTEQFSPTSKITEFKYDYSQAWHLIGKDFVHENHRREAYTYDSLYRLRRVDYDCPENANDPTCIGSRSDDFLCETDEENCDSFTLDGVQNIATSKESGPWNSVNGQEDYSWTVDGLNRLTQKSDGTNSVTYLYDAQNNLISESDGTTTTTYLYDDLNRLILWNSGTREVKYTYDAFNRRIGKEIYENGQTLSTETHSYAYHGWDIYQETVETVDKTITNRYIDVGMDNHIVMMKHTDFTDELNPDTDEEYWFHKDERGNVIAVTDGNSTVLQRYRYSVYGEVAIIAGSTTELISPFLWGGSLYEPETGLYWMRNRYYNTGMKRFINQDPIGIWGDANNLGNGFAYVGGMIVEASDPTGLAPGGGAGGSKRDSLAFYNMNGIGNNVAVNSLIDNNNSLEPLMASSAFLSGPLGWTGYGLGKIPGAFGWSGAGVEWVSFIINASRGNPFALYDLVAFTVGVVKRTSDTLDKQKNGSRINSANPTVTSSDWRNLPDGGDVPDFSESDDSGGSGGETTTDDDPEDVTPDDDSEDVTPDPTWTYTYKDPITGKCQGSDDNKTWLPCDCPATVHPSNPWDEPTSTPQQMLINQLLRQRLGQTGDSGPKVFRDTNTGPNGAVMFYRSPYYRGKDPIKSILTNGTDGAGRPIIMRNPMSLPATYVPWNSTAERWMQSPLNPGNIDPCFE